MSARTVRVAVVGLGPIGVSIGRLAAVAAGLDLVGGADVDPKKRGRDLGELLGGSPSGIVVEESVTRLLDTTRPDLVLHATGSALPAVAPQLRACLQRGVPVVSTCEELAYPYYRHPELARDLDRCAAEHDAVLLGSGVNPGFVLDKFVATTLSACTRVRKVRAVRALDAATRREPFRRKVGVGLTTEEFEAERGGGRIGHVGLAESAHLVADVIGVSRERALREEIRPHVSAEPIRSAGVTVEPGRVAGIHQVATLEERGEERVRMELEMRVGTEQPRDQILVDGSPSLEVTVAGGVPGDEATAAVTVNAALGVEEMRPGLRTMLDAPLRYRLGSDGSVPAR